MKEYWLARVQQDGWTLQFVPTELKTKEFLRDCYRVNNRCLEFIPKEFHEFVKQPVGQRTKPSLHDAPLPATRCIQCLTATCDCQLL